MDVSVTNPKERTKFGFVRFDTCQLNEFAVAVNCRQIASPLLAKAHSVDPSCGFCRNLGH